MSGGELSNAIDLADAELAGGNARAAFLTLRPFLDHPAPSLDDREVLTRTMAAFARISHAIAGAELGSVLDRVVHDVDDVKALYDAGYALYEQHLYAVAATLLARADRLAPGQSGIVAELSSALEGAMQYHAAAIAVDRSGLADADPMMAYLSGFNWMMVGDTERARARYAVLEPVDDPQFAHVRGVLGGMLRRADALRDAGVELGEHALTAWHAILNGALLTHESPYGHDEPMHGRYAFLNDNPGLMREGIDTLITVLDAAGHRPERVIAAPDRASSILALACARVLALPMVPWSADVGAGLVMAWNLDTVRSVAFSQALRVHRPGQILFAHVSDWIDPFPYSPDITTLLAQTILHPYLGEPMRVDPATGKVGRGEPDTRDDDALAEEIVAQVRTPESAVPRARVLRIAQVLAELPEADRIGLHRTEGTRLRQRAGSAVASNRFG